VSSNPESGRASAYTAAGVDIAAGERAVELMKRHTSRARRPEVVDDPSGFAGLFRLDIGRYRRPMLTTSTDGVGTKVLLAQAMGVHDTIGIDLVGMVVDDLVVVGAEPLFLTDYIACGAVVPERIAEIVAGVAEGCTQAGCALIGGETAEHPGVMQPQEYDLAGAATGIVETDALLGPDRVRPGDVLVAMGSSGPHSNGYSLIRRVIAEAGLNLDSPMPELGGGLGETLLTPTRIYTADCLSLAEAVEVHAYAHITGGGLAANLERSLPQGAGAVVDRAGWRPQPVFSLIAESGGIVQEDMESTFNMGVGMVAVVAASARDEALAHLRARDVPAWVMGEVDDAQAGVRLVGEYAS
jgi:phosphoribosylformylglycinamidine cyclo-ligase